MYFIGIDLGTSSVKILLTDERGRPVASKTKRYEVEYPRPGWSQQAPEDWYEATITGLREILQGRDGSCVAGIGIGGQMHGLVLLDAKDQVIRPAILWNDGRTEEEVAYLNGTVGQNFLFEATANIAFAGFTAPKMLWIQKHEPENYNRISKLMLPKDYLVYRLTGAHTTDFSDASGTLFLDVKHRRWSDAMCDFCGIRKSWLPRLHESTDVVGCLRTEIAADLGLFKIPVVAGAGDNAAAAIGTGTVKDGDCNISLGTSGTLFVASDRFCAVPDGALHLFAHANGRYHFMGCMLSAASCVDWWLRILDSGDYQGECQKGGSLMGDGNVLFLPYLMGERSPLNDVNARGAFIGMTAATSRAAMTLAVLEGVGFALRDSLEVVRGLGICVKRSTCCGGGTRIPFWPQILSNILNIALDLPALEEGPALGGAILSMVAAGVYPSVEEAAAEIVNIREHILPDPVCVARYEERYQLFRNLYPVLKEHFRRAAALAL